MEEIQKCVVESLDGAHKELYRYLPYILQDLWEFGADPKIMLSLIKENIENRKLKVLDLGCGKGAVSIAFAKELNCSVTGIDAMPDFIESAKIYAEIYRVNDFCKFETGDIRRRIYKLKEFDIAILGAIGPVFGNLYETLQIIKNALKADGYVLLDDAFVEENSLINYNRCLRKSEFYKMISAAGFDIVKEVIIDKNAIEDSDRSIFSSIEKRVNELINEHPKQRALLHGYLESQEFENNLLEKELICGTWLLKRR
jgi:SAM-dependent methyltransferase